MDFGNPCEDECDTKWVKVSAFNNLSYSDGTAGTIQYAGINGGKNDITLDAPKNKYLRGWRFGVTVDGEKVNQFVAEKDGLYEFNYISTFQNYNVQFKQLYPGWLPGQRFIYLDRHNQQLAFQNAFLGQTVFVTGPKTGERSSNRFYQEFCLLNASAVIPLKKGDYVIPQLYADFEVISPDPPIPENPFIGCFTEIQVTLLDEQHFNFVPEGVGRSKPSIK